MKEADLSIEIYNKLKKVVNDSTAHHHSHIKPPTLYHGPRSCNPFTVKHEQLTATADDFGIH
jgi:hypothetical protein